MFFCEMCGSGDCCERTDIHGGPILCDTCYMEAKQDQEDKDAIEEIFKDNQDIGGEGSGIKISQRRPSKGYHLQIREPDNPENDGLRNRKTKWSSGNRGADGGDFGQRKYGTRLRI